MTCRTGTRLWYPFWNAEEDDDAAFERRVDPVVREIGDRAKRMRPRVDSTLTVAPAPAPAPAAASAPAPQLAASTTSPTDSFAWSAIERDELARQVRNEISSQVASMELSATELEPAMPSSSSTSMSQQQHLSEAFYLERADRLDRAERTL